MNPAVQVSRRRLHPLTPLLRGGRAAVFLVAALSWQGLAGLGAEGFLVAVAALAVVAVIVSVVSWLVTGYEVVGRELRITDGLLFRRNRAIPLERLQAIEVVQPLAARLFGLAELRLEVVGAARTEAPLAYLDAHDAARLRALLLALGPGAARSSDQGHGEPAATLTAGGGERIVHVVPNGLLVLAQLLRPTWWLLPIGLALPVIFFVQDRNYGFIALASTVTAVLGTAIAPVRIVLAEWGFTVASGPDGLRLRRGLTETRSQTVPAGRVQTVTVSWPLLWRLTGWVRATMTVAGVRARREDEGGTGSLVPVGTVAAVEYVIGYVLPGFTLTRVHIHPPPARARLLAPLRAGVLGYQLGDTVFLSRSGLLVRRLTIVPYARIQSVRVRQGVVQRVLGLASVYVDTAGGGEPPAAEHRRVAEAAGIAAELAHRARQARRTPAPPTQPPPTQPGPVGPVSGPAAGAPTDQVGPGLPAPAT